MKLAAILDSPTPYTTPVFNALSERADLHVVYLAGSDRVGRFADTWGVTPRFAYSLGRLKALDVASIDLHLELSIGAARRLSRLEPDAILLVSWKPTVLEPLLWSRWTGAAAVMWGESTHFSGLLRGRISTRLRERTVRLFDGYVTNGSEATRYLRTLGVPRERIVTSTLPAGLPSATTARAAGLPSEGVRFLFVGRLIPQKRARELVHAFAGVRERLPDATLTIVGGGELEAEIEKAVARTPGARFVGRREGAKLAEIYATSDVLVLPALREVWGIVVNEALAHGLFVVTTDQVGSAYDLLDESNGVVLPAEDLGRLAPTLVEVGRTLDTSDDARERRAAAVAGCTPERFADDIARAVEIAVCVRASRPRRGGTPRARRRR